MTGCEQCLLKQTVEPAGGRNIALPNCARPAIMALRMRGRECSRAFFCFAEEFILAIPFIIAIFRSALCTHRSWRHSQHSRQPAVAPHSRKQSTSHTDARGSE